jgi:uncharacterized protein YutE (UPF0331/DUF86 family)
VIMKTVQSKIAVVIDRVERLKRLSDKINTFNTYAQSADLKDLAERNLQIAIEACFDIGKIIISQKMLRDPKDNKDIFVILAEAGIIGLRSLEFLTPMAGTRNILVHGYDKVDDSLVYGILKRHLNDFDIFLTEIRDNYLSKI